MSRHQEFVESFNIDLYDGNHPLIIYGAGAFGEIARVGLIKWGVRPDFYCDRIAEKGYGNTPVIRPEQIKEYRDACYIIASADAFNEILHILLREECRHIFDMNLILGLNYEDNELSQRALDYLNNKELYLNCSKVTFDNIFLNKVSYSVTDRCSMRCRDCTHLMQYYSDPQDIDIFSDRIRFNKFLDTIDYLNDMRILGGEPFMNRDMYNLLEWYNKHPKIGFISIYTNGTIIPDSRSMEVLKKTSPRIHISDYGINSVRVQKLVYELEKYGIDYYVRRYDSWQDAGDLRYKNEDEEVLKRKFESCYERNCYIFYRGKLHRCPRAAHGEHLGAIPEADGDSVDFTKEDADINILKKQIKELMSKSFLHACSYCSGPSYHGAEIPSAVQTKEVMIF